MEVLLYLAQRQDQVIRRDELISDVWHSTFVTDEVLSRAISMLRTRLGDDRMTPRYIQTLPKVGYRLLMEVKPLTAAATKSEKESQSDHSADLWNNRKWLVGISLTVIVIATLVMWNRPEGEIEPRSASTFKSITEWIDFLTEKREGTTGVTSIAVLPFDNVSENGDSTFFSEALTDELTMSLSKVKGLKVVARRSSYSFKNRTDDVPTIGRLLNADAIFEGTIRRDGERLRINAQLCDVSDGFLMWSANYERDASDIFDVREEIATAVVEAMREHFEDDALQTPLANQAPPDIEAYQLYLMNGNFQWKLRGEQPIRKSIELYRQTLAIAMQAKREGKFSRPSIEFGLWIAIGGVDQAYETFYALHDSYPHFLHLEFIFTDEAREFREDPRFEQLAKDIGWKEYWQTFGGPDN